MQNTLLSSPKHPIWSVSLTPGPSLHSLTARFACFIHPLLLTLSNQSSMLFCRGMHASLTYILPLPLIPLPLLILFVHLLLLSCHAELPQVIRQNETVAFHEFASDILIFWWVVLINARVRPPSNAVTPINLAQRHTTFATLPLCIDCSQHVLAANEATLLPDANLCIFFALFSWMNNRAVFPVMRTTCFAPLEGAVHALG